jgi:ADP-heptose:LPS heptosyltransferase
VNISSILLMERYGLGDGVLCTPVVEALSAAYPQARITTYASPYVAELRRTCPLVHEIIPAGGEGQLLRRCFDATVDLTGRLSMARLCRRIGSPIRVGAPWWRLRVGASLFYTHVVRDRPGQHVVEHKLDLARRLGAQVSNPMRLRVWLKPEDEEAARRWLAQAGAPMQSGLLALNIAVGGKRTGSQLGRRWPIEAFAELSELARKSLRLEPVVVGGPEDAAHARQLASLVSGRVLVAAGQLSIMETAALLKQCEAIVSGDTGPMHLGAAVGVPVVAIFGRSDPGWSGPWGKHEIVRAGFACSPCRGRPHSRWRPCLRNYDCVSAVKPEQAFLALVRILSPAPLPPAPVGGVPIYGDAAGDQK